VYDVYSLRKTDFGKVILASNFAAGSGKGSAISGKTVKSIKLLFLYSNMRWDRTPGHETLEQQDVNKSSSLCFPP